MQKLTKLLLTILLLLNVFPSLGSSSQDSSSSNATAESSNSDVMDESSNSDDVNAQPEVENQNPENNNQVNEVNLGNLQVHDKNTFINFTSQDNKYLFVLTTPQDKERILSMYANDPEGTQALFGDQHPGELIDQDIEGNQNFIDNNSIPPLFSWSVFSLESPGTPLIAVFTAQIMTQDDDLIKDIQKAYPNGIQNQAVYINLNMFVDKTYRTQNKGTGTNLCQLYTSNIFNNTNANYIISYSVLSNIASQTSSQRCGFQPIGQFRHADKDNILLIKGRN